MGTAILVVLLLGGLGVGGYFLYKEYFEKDTGSDKEADSKKKEK